MGFNAGYKLSKRLVSELHSRNIIVLQQAWKGGFFGHSNWSSAQDLNLEGTLVDEWDRYMDGVVHAGIFISNTLDKLVWGQNNKNGMVTTKLAYKLIFEKENMLNTYWWTKWL